MNGRRLLAGVALATVAVAGVGGLVSVLTTATVASAVSVAFVGGTVLAVGRAGSRAVPRLETPYW